MSMKWPDIVRSSLDTMVQLLQRDVYIYTCPNYRGDERYVGGTCTCRRWNQKAVAELCMCVKLPLARKILAFTGTGMSLAVCMRCAHTHFMTVYIYLIQER